MERHRVVSPCDSHMFMRNASSVQYSSPCTPSRCVASQSSLPSVRRRSCRNELGWSGINPPKPYLVPAEVTHNFAAAATTKPWRGRQTTATFAKGAFQPKRFIFNARQKWTRCAPFSPDGQSCRETQLCACRCVVRRFPSKQRKKQRFVVCAHVACSQPQKRRSIRLQRSLTHTQIRKTNPERYTQDAALTSQPRT